MPKFLDLFVAELRRSADTFRDILAKGKTSALDSAFRQHFEEHWHTLRHQEGLPKIGWPFLDDMSAKKSYKLHSSSYEVSSGV